MQSGLASCALICFWSGRALTSAVAHLVSSDTHQISLLSGGRSLATPLASLTGQTSSPQTLRDCSSKKPMGKMQDLERLRLQSACQVLYPSEPQFWTIDPNHELTHLWYLWRVLQLLSCGSSHKAHSYRSLSCADMGRMTRSDKTGTRCI